MLIQRNYLTQIGVIIITIKMAIYNNNGNNGYIDKVYQDFRAKGDEPTHPPYNKVFLKNSRHYELVLSIDAKKEYELT